MAKRTGKKATKGSARSKDGGGREHRVEKALETALRREAKAASRLEAAQAETATLRVLLASLVEPSAVEPSAAEPTVAAPTVAGQARARGARPVAAPDTASDR